MDINAKTKKKGLINQKTMQDYYEKIRKVQENREMFEKGSYQADLEFLGFQDLSNVIEDE